MVSSKTKGAMAWTSYSMDVLVEGQAVARFADATTHNGNTFNSAFLAKGDTGFYYGDDKPCPVCKEGIEKHVVPEKELAAVTATALIGKLMEQYTAQKAQIERFRTQAGAPGG